MAIDYVDVKRHWSPETAENKWGEPTELPAPVTTRKSREPREVNTARRAIWRKARAGAV